MEQHDYRQLINAEHKERLRWLFERAKFRKNIESAISASEVVSAKSQELNKLVEELQLTRADTRSLRVELNRTALRLGLQPLESRRTKR